jgi:YD repeat-containing protein
VGNRLTYSDPEETVEYEYDAANRLIRVDEVEYTWDDNGNLLDDGVNEYSYDAANRLISVITPSGTTTYAYDGLGNRYQQTVNEVTTTYNLDIASGLTQVLGDGTNTYIYGLQRIAQINGEGTEYSWGMRWDR